MKKIPGILLFILCLINASFAFSVIGAREAAMGMTGVASARGLSAVVYNPAGLLRGPDKEFLWSIGAAHNGLDQLYNAATSSDPAKFLQNNYNKTIDVNGNIATLVGGSMNKVGISVLVPDMKAVVNKPTAGTYSGTSANITGSYGLVVTLGHSLDLANLNIATLDMGVNLKALNGYHQSFIASSATSATNISAQGTGTGMDIGAIATVAVPYVSSFSVGACIQNIGQSFTYEPKTRTDTLNPDGSITSGIETAEAKRTDTMPGSTLIGCSGTLPFGLAFAADIESLASGSGYFATGATSITHLGVEYPMMANAILLRAGTASSDLINRTTFGAKLNLPILNLDIASVIDNKNSKNNTWVFNFGAGI